MNNKDTSEYSDESIEVCASNSIEFRYADCIDPLIDPGEHPNEDDWHHAERAFLDKHIFTQERVIVIMKTGGPRQGFVIAHDNASILLRSNSPTTPFALLRKRQISLIAPESAITGGESPPWKKVK